MTFNLKDREKAYNYQSPLLNSNSNIDQQVFKQLNEIEINYMDFIRYHNDLKEFNRKIPTFTKKEYEKTKDDIHYKIQLLPGLLTKINSLTERIYSSQEELPDVVLEKLTVVKENLNNKISDLPNLIQEIYEREKIASLKLRNIKISESQLDDSLSVLHRSDYIRESKLMVREVVANQAYLEKRKEDLEMIKKVSHQLREITVFMGEEVKLQGEALNKLLSEVESIRDNMQASEDLISNAEKDNKSQTRKILLLFLVLFLLVAVIVTIILFIFVF